jgi:hypothetical protein
MRTSQKVNLFLLILIPLMLAIVGAPAFVQGWRSAGRDPNTPLIQLYRPAERMRIARTVEALDTSPYAAPALWIWISPSEEFAVVPPSEESPTIRVLSGARVWGVIRAEQMETHMIPGRMVHPDDPVR